MGLVVAGTIAPEVEPMFRQATSADPRISCIGWTSAERLTSLLCAADIYIQPGTQSVIMQQSMCARCATIVNDDPSHSWYACDNGWRIGRDGDLGSILQKALRSDLLRMGMRSFEFARRHLDYVSLARRIFR